MEELFILPISKSRKPKAGLNQLLKMYYGKAAASGKAASKSSPFGWAFGFGFWPKSQSQKPNQPDPQARATFKDVSMPPLMLLSSTICIHLLLLN